MHPEKSKDLSNSARQTALILSWMFVLCSGKQPDLGVCPVRL